MAEGVRDDFKVMTGIYGRLCAYLDHAAAAPAPTPAAATGPLPPSVGGATPAVSPPAEPAVAATSAAVPSLPMPAARESAVLSTFVAGSPPLAAAAGAGAVEGGGVGGVESEEEEEMIEGVMNDLEVRVLIVTD